MGHFLDKEFVHYFYTRVSINRFEDKLKICKKIFIMGSPPTLPFSSCFLIQIVFILQSKFSQFLFFTFNFIVLTVFLNPCWFMSSTSEIFYEFTWDVLSNTQFTFRLFIETRRYLPFQFIIPLFKTLFSVYLFLYTKWQFLYP